MEYGQKPKLLQKFQVEQDEFFSYLYLPIKMAKSMDIIIEKRLNKFEPIIGAALCDYIGFRGLDDLYDSYVYLTAKCQYQTEGDGFNRYGFHSDGFLTPDVNYIWCNKQPTVFNCGPYNLTMDDKVSLGEMEQQSLPENNFTYPANSLLRLDQYVIHKVGEIEKGVRTFAKVSISKDKYDLVGNSRNYEIDYQWDMFPRGVERNVPQKIKG